MPIAFSKYFIDVSAQTSDITSMQTYRIQVVSSTQEILTDPILKKKKKKKKRKI